MNLVVVVLTFNEELHLARCLESVSTLGARVVVVDCFSTDATQTIAERFDARLLRREWDSHAAQFNWALTQIDVKTDWVLRLDADEYVTPELASEIRTRLPSMGADVDGIYLNRRIKFQGKMIRYGGVFPIGILRLFRYGRGRCENRWMDEHIKVAGLTECFQGELIDDNLNTLNWWTEKHNRYASREAVDLLNLEKQFAPRDSVANLRGAQAGVKRWIKEEIYARLPLGLRAFSYFFYRYIVRFGFLDGKEGASFHILQGFWYRYLVDAKVAEVKRCMRERNLAVEDAIRQVLGVNV